VAFHHAPGQASAHPTEAAVVHLADVIVHALDLGKSGDPRVPPVEAAAWDRVGLPTGALGGVLDEIDRQLAAASSLLAPEPGPGRAPAGAGRAG
jgi:hypothetical protein